MKITTTLNSRKHITFK